MAKGSAWLNDVKNTETIIEVKVSAELKLGYELAIRWCHHANNMDEMATAVVSSVIKGDPNPIQKSAWGVVPFKKPGPVLHSMLLRACLDLCSLKSAGSSLPVTLLWAAPPGHTVRPSLRATCNLVFTVRFAEATAWKKKMVWRFQSTDIWTQASKCASVARTCFFFSFLIVWANKQTFYQDFKSSLCSTHFSRRLLKYKSWEKVWK